MPNLESNNFLTRIIWCCLFVILNTQAQENTEATSSDTPLDEVIITAPGPRADLIIRSGWRPKTPEEAHQHIKNAYALLEEMEGLAKKCNPDAIVTYRDKLRLRPCEKFLDVHDSRALTNYRLQCEGLVGWYEEISTAFQQRPDWISADEETLLGYSFFKQNILLTCDLKTVIKNFKYLDTARRDINKIRDFVENARNPPVGVGGFTSISNIRPTEEEEDF